MNFDREAGEYLYVATDINVGVGWYVTTAETAQLRVRFRPVVDWRHAQLAKPR